MDMPFFTITVGFAVNGVMQNWDTYGRMAHNYVVYNDPGTGLLTWIPWDSNEALKDGNGPQGGALTLSLDEAGDRGGLPERALSLQPRSLAGSGVLSSPPPRYTQRRRRAVADTRMDFVLASRSHHLFQPRTVPNQPATPKASYGSPEIVAAGHRARLSLRELSWGKSEAIAALSPTRMSDRWPSALLTGQKAGTMARRYGLISSDGRSLARLDCGPTNSLERMTGATAAAGNCAV